MIPKELATLLSHTARRAIALTPTAAQVHHDLYASKIGGVPYFPKNALYPTNDDGVPLALLAQLNLSDIFKDAELLSACEQDAALKHLPKSGMLSFFYDITDDLMGLDLEKTGRGNGSAVHYFTEILPESALTQVPFKALRSHIQDDNADDYGALSIDQAVGLTASIKETLYELESESFGNPEIEAFKTALEAYTESLEDEDEEESVMMAIYDAVDATNYGHAVGGYPNFTQFDPRERAQNQQFLLLQIDSIGDVLIGDCGSIQFFMTMEALEQRDFNHVLYDWACG
ncbi:YwqG family protein [Wohlfahrtiimonas chitiniclastica]|uniref:YwqG family protein n=1 Tax=Wohlfahrtiimonas chitiniclastica TaxID=400946 RepID=UPI000B98DC08|nr:DUF1963 domain-containing protein [Wohlfahrtiimonas chitiniclastica]OYQ76314.1 hypothetical protein B9T18_02855 [Wohlfahrtiimonas chitiniclastica]